MNNVASRNFPAAFSNPLAQPWRLPNFEAKDVNLNWKYGGTFVIPAGTLQQNNAVLVNGGSDFLCRELAFQTSLAYNAGTLRARFKDPDGKRRSADLLQIEDLEGPVPIDWFCGRSTPVLVDLQNLDTNPVTVQVIMKGIEIFRPLGINNCMPGFNPESYTPAFDFYSVPAPGWHDEPFDYYFELPNTALGNRQGTPLPMDGDADFFMRGITGYGTGGAQLLRFLDAFQNQLSNAYVPQANELGAAPFARPILPEVCCPAYSVLNVDQIEYLGEEALLKIALRGVKRFRD